SMNFYTEFLAAIDVYEHREDYFGPLALDRPTAPTPVMVAASGYAAGTDRPAKATPPARTTPVKAAPVKTTPVKTTSYTVRRGDTLTDIAQRFRTSIQQLAARNNLAGHSIYAGQILIIK